jgi:hypothetical protein
LLGQDSWSRCWESAQCWWELGLGLGQKEWAALVFVLGLVAVSTDTQYFGPGTRLTVLGKLSALEIRGEEWGRSGMPGGDDWACF